MMSDDELQKRLAKVEQLQQRLEAEIAAWGELCKRIEQWANEGHNLRAEVSETSQASQANMELMSEVTEFILESASDDIDEADWWKNE